MAEVTADSKNDVPASAAPIAAAPTGLTPANSPQIQPSACGRAGTLTMRVAVPVRNATLIKTLGYACAVRREQMHKFIVVRA